ncbi:phage protein [Vibrio phage pTD1]|uniref:Phage protein n=1 Tax=Vibrio phage pTD1 TaxID=1938577 RepID=A0A1Q2U304_9CAUD|nr:terminase large subunit [Vibrio phage pTD1]BAW98365.1 phage protein [Vibrio phage pTD1]
MGAPLEFNLIEQEQVLKYLNIQKDTLPTKMVDDPSDDVPERSWEELLETHWKEDTLRSIKTVRFMKDFQRYRARPDMKTSNTSFIRTMDVFRKMKVKNCAFHLQLNNPALVGVNPRDPNLTDDQRLMIMQEMRENFWYFLREVCHLNGGIRFRANRANISFAWCWLNHLTTMLILPRQQGKTVTAQCIFFWLTYISGRAYESHLITLKDDNRQQFVDAIKGIRNNIPSWMTNVTYRDKDAGNSLTYSAFGDEVKNKLTISVPQIGQEAARNVGRGLTIKSRFIDEPAYIKWMEEILNGAGPSTLTARENARRLNEPYATGFITTPASVLTESGAYMYNILMESTEWRENYFDTYSESHLYDVLLKNSPKATTSPSVGMVFNYLQLGKDRDWVKRTIDELKLSLSEAKIDLLLMWDDNGKGKLFDDETRDALNDAKRGRVWSQQIAGTSLFFDWFISPEEHAEIMSGAKASTFYLIGLDTSGAVGRDACTIVVRDIRNGKVVGVGRYQRAFLTEVGMVVQTLLTELPDSLLIPERNYAHHMIDQLLQSLPAMGLDPFKKIYNRIFQDPMKYQNHYRDIKARSFGNRNDAFYLKYKEFFGFNTGAKSRETMYGFLEEAVSLTGSGTHYTKLIDELTNLKLKNGRIDHDTGNHDDIVISWLLTYWFIKLGENKNEYGIPNGISLSSVDMLRLGDAKKELPDPVQEKRTAFYKQKIEEVTAKLFETDDPIIAARLEVALDRLHAMIPNEIRKSITIDDIKRKAEEERRIRSLENKRGRPRR